MFWISISVVWYNGSIPSYANHLTDVTEFLLFPHLLLVDFLTLEIEVLFVSLSYIRFSIYPNIEDKKTHTNAVLYRKLLFSRIRSFIKC